MIHWKENFENVLSCSILQVLEVDSVFSWLGNEPGSYVHMCFFLGVRDPQTVEQ